MTSQGMSTGEKDQFSNCHSNWVTQQKNDLKELLQVLNEEAQDEAKLRHLAETNMKHFEEYCDNRAILAHVNAPIFFSPTYCSTYENSYSWLAGFRPTLSIRLVYTICGAELESHLDEYLQGDIQDGLGNLSAMQLTLINELQCRTIEHEEKLSNQMASLQENMADNPLALMAYISKAPFEFDRDADTAIDTSSLALATILEESDELRVNTLKDMIKILTPLQTVDFLVASKKLHLSIHEGGKRRDHQHGW